MSLRKLCEIRIHVVIIVVVGVVVVVLIFILFPTVVSVVKNNGIFCTTYDVNCLVLKAVILKIQNFGNIKPCLLVNNSKLRLFYFLCLCGARVFRNN